MVLELSEGVSGSCAVGCLVTLSFCLVVVEEAEDINNDVAERGRLIVFGYTTIGFFGTVGCRVTKTCQKEMEWKGEQDEEEERNDI